MPNTTTNTTLAQASTRHTYVLDGEIPAAGYGHGGWKLTVGVVTVTETPDGTTGSSVKVYGIRTDADGNWLTPSIRIPASDDGEIAEDLLNLVLNAA